MVILLGSLSFNVHAVIKSAPLNTTPFPRNSFEDQKLQFQPKVKQNGSTIECQREFFLFHQDHVIEFYAFSR